MVVARTTLYLDGHYTGLHPPTERNLQEQIQVVEAGKRHQGRGEAGIEPDSSGASAHAHPTRLANTIMCRLRRDKRKADTHKLVLI